MRKIFSVLVLVLASVVGYAQQAETLTAVAGSCNVLSVSAPGGGEPGDFYVTALFNDISGQWIDSSVVAGYILWDVDGNRFNIDSVDYGGIIDLWVTDLDTAGTVATGIGAIVQENDNYPFWVAGISQGLNQIINAHMVQMIGGDIASGGGGGPALVYSEATLADTTTFWRDPDSHVNAYLGQWTRIAPDRQFMTITDLKDNTNKIPWRAGEIVQVNGFSSNEGSARYLVAASIDTTNEFHVRDTTFFDLGGGKYAILSKKHNDYIYPEMVGAVGDGVADDTRALRILHFYADKIRYGFQKVYKTTAFVAIKPRQEVDLNQSRIEHYQNYLSPCFDAVLADNAVIRNGHIQGMDTLINPADLPGFDGYLLYRPEVGNVWNQSGILAQDVDSLVVKDMVIHNYRQGISVLSQIYSGPNVNIWERDVSSAWQNGANWDGSDNDNRVYIRDCDLGENLFGLLGGGNKLIDIDGLIGDVLPPDTMPVQIYAPPHLVYITAGGNDPDGYCENFIGRNITGLPSRDVQDVSILKLASVKRAIVENLVVDSIEVALEFAGQYLHARNIVGTRMYGGFIRMYSGDGRLGTTAEETFKVIENVSAEFIGESPGNFKYGIQLSGIGGFTIRNASFKWTDPDNTRGLLGDAVDFLPIELINSDSNFIENVRADFLQSSVPIRNAVRIANNSSNNYIKNVSCLNCNHVVDDATETSGSGNVIAYDAGESMFSTLVNYGTNELREWDQDKVRFIVTGGGEQGTIVNNFAYFNYVRGIPIIDEAKAPQFKNNSTGGPDYPIQVKVVNNGGNIPINRNGYMGILSQEGDFEYPYRMPDDGESITYTYLFDESTQKFLLYNRAESIYADNPAGSSDNVQSALDDLNSDIQAIPTVSPTVTASTGRATVDSILNVSPSADIGFSPQNGDVFYADFTNPNFTEKGFYGYEEGTWKKFMFDTTAYVAITDSMTLDYYPNSVGAYSVRKLRFGYSGDCIRVRRSSDDAEQNIGFDSNGDLDTTSLKTFVGANDGFVVTWFDQSGAGNNLGQSDNSEQPKIVSSGTVIRENGLPAIESDGTDDWMFTPIVVSDTLDSFVGTVHAVAQVTNPDSSTTQTVTSILPGWDGTYVSRGYIGVSFENSATAARLSGGNTVFDTGDEEVQSIFSMAHLAPDSAFVGRLDGADIGISSTGANNVLNIKEDSGFTLFFFAAANYDQSYIVSPPLDADDYSQGKVQEVIWYFNNNWSERAGIQTDMNTYFSVY